MELLFFGLGLLMVLLGILGAVIPALPGPPLSWLGLLFLYLTKAVDMSMSFLVITFLIAIGVYLIDLFMPAWGTKKFGGSKKGAYGAIIGVVVALLIPIFGPFGFLIFPFLGAYIGELIYNKASTNKLKSAIGSLIGFLAGTLLKLVLSIVYLVYFIQYTWEFKSDIF
jgi:uncharacterized protein YqgC (DUF456 family)